MRQITLWFGLATFWCSALIFWVEPLVGKQLLPLVGGAPAVWNVCLLFFQIALLGGYLAAHGITRISSARAQGAIYLAVALVAVLTLPVEFDTAPADPSNPTLWLLGQLTLELFAPFIALAAAAPLLQHWYSRTTAASARDPYFLYAASNAGSLIALLLFPVLIEPQLRIHTQNSVWAVLFSAGIMLAAAAATQARMRPTTQPPTGHSPPSDAPAASASATPSAPAAEAASTPAASASATHAAPAARPPARELLMWVVLAAVPSSLLMGVTSHLTADIAPVPLLWVIPLAIYLGTFIAAFGWLRSGLPSWFGRWAVVMAVVWCTLYRIDATDPLRLIVIVHLLAFTTMALGAHVRLAKSRPPAVHLTTYYLAIAAGGALGGTFNALIAPSLFESFFEYPVAMLLAVWLTLRGDREKPDAIRDFAPLGLLLVVLAIGLVVPLPFGAPRAFVVAMIPIVIAYALSQRILRFTLALALILLAGQLDSTFNNRVLLAERNFYGLLRVRLDDEQRHHELLHGNTLHGAMALHGPTAGQPLAYYWTGSPVADIIASAQQRRDSLAVAVVGLGVGALAWYAQPDESWTFYEINPAVIEVARDSTLFTFLEHSRAGQLDIVPGDARLMLQHAPADAFDVIVLDAFTSDAIPLHILTVEAVQLYLDKLRPGGLLVFHVSNRYLDLTPPVAAVGRAHGLHTYLRIQQISEEQAEQRITSSDWLVLAREPTDFPIAATGGWLEAHAPGVPVWSDDYSNIWTAFAR